MSVNRMLVLARREIQRLLSMDECIAAVEAAFRMHGEGKAPAPQVLGVHADGGGFHIKAGVLQLGRHYFAAKVNGNFPDNPARSGLPTIQGVIVLADADDGRPLAVMDSIEITNLRTGAATAVAAKYLARRNSRTVTICGCGNQGTFQLRALARVAPIAQVFAYDISADCRRRFAQTLSAELEVEITPVEELHTAVRKSDVCVTCTPSQQAFLGREDVAPGTFIAAVGADNPAKQELQPALMTAGKIVVDILEQCATMGDLHHALASGAVSRDRVHAELGEVVAGKKTGRSSEEEITIFDSTGMALQDVAAAALVYENAVQSGQGCILDLAA